MFLILNEVLVCRYERNGQAAGLLLVPLHGPGGHPEGTKTSKKDTKKKQERSKKETKKVKKRTKKKKRTRKERIVSAMEEGLGVSRHTHSWSQWRPPRA